MTHQLTDTAALNNLVQLCGEENNSTYKLSFCSAPRTTSLLSLLDFCHWRHIYKMQIIYLNFQSSHIIFPQIKDTTECTFSHHRVVVMLLDSDAERSCMLSPLVSSRLCLAQIFKKILLRVRLCRQQTDVSTSLPVSIRLTGTAAQSGFTGRTGGGTGGSWRWRWTAGGRH